MFLEGLVFSEELLRKSGSMEEEGRRVRDRKEWKEEKMWSGYNV